LIDNGEWRTVICIFCADYCGRFDFAQRPQQGAQMLAR